MRLNLSRAKKILGTSLLLKDNKLIASVMLFPSLARGLVNVHLVMEENSELQERFIVNQFRANDVVNPRSELVDPVYFLDILTKSEPFNQLGEIVEPIRKLHNLTNQRANCSSLNHIENYTLIHNY